MPKYVGYGNPRQKLREVSHQSGVADSAAVRLEKEAFGTAGKPSKSRKKKQPKSLRQKIIMRLREIGMKQREKAMAMMKKKKEK